MKHRRLVLVLIASLGLASCMESGISEKEMKYLVSLKDFQKYNTVIPEKFEKFQNFSKMNFIGGSFRVNNYFEVEDDRLSIKRLDCEADFNVTKSENLYNKFIKDKTNSSVFKAFGIRYEEKNETYSFGDNSKLFYIVAKNGVKVGNFFIAKIDDSIFQVSFIGLTLTERQQWVDLVENKLIKIRDR